MTHCAFTEDNLDEPFSQRIQNQVCVLRWSQFERILMIKGEIYDLSVVDTNGEESVVVIVVVDGEEIG